MTIVVTIWVVNANMAMAETLVLMIRLVKGPFTINVRADIFGVWDVEIFKRTCRTLNASQNPLRNCERTISRGCGGHETPEMTNFFHVKP